MKTDEQEEKRQFVEDVQKLKDAERRREFIETIENLFPVDDASAKTADIGFQLLLEAIAESDWRTLPTEILELYALKCERELSIAANAATHNW